jgi:hypothetical protein
VRRSPAGPETGDCPVEPSGVRAPPAPSTLERREPPSHAGPAAAGLPLSGSRERYEATNSAGWLANGTRAPRPF